MTDYATQHRWQNRVRWNIAYALNRLPRTCWANLVSWAMRSRPLIGRHGDGDIRQDWMCRRDAADNGHCYCGKLSRSDRGAADILQLCSGALLIALPAVALLAGYTGHPIICTVLATVCVMVGGAVLVGRAIAFGMGPHEDDAWEAHVADAIDLATLPLAKRVAADMARDIDGEWLGLAEVPVREWPGWGVV
jgi:hypothetical protein